MKRFIISYADFYDYSLQMTEVKADSRIEALYNGAVFFGADTSYYTTDEEKFKEYCFDQDFIIEAYEIQ